MNGIGYILRRLRKEKGITQRDIYSNLCSRKHHSRLENNTSFPSVYLLYHICQRLEVTIDEVIKLTLEGESNGNQHK